MNDEIPPAFKIAVQTNGLSLSVEGKTKKEVLFVFNKVLSKFWVSEPVKEAEVR